MKHRTGLVRKSRTKFGRRVWSSARESGEHNGNAFRQEIERQERNARREQLDSGKLLTEAEFRKRLNISVSRLVRMIASGSVFVVEVEGVEYFPALLAADEIDLRRLHSICRILVPAPPWSRFHYLTSRRASLGGITPVETLKDDKQYRLSRAMAAAWAADFSRTSVSIHAGRCEDMPTDIEPIVTADDEIDPRTNLWKRVAAALQVRGYIHPCGPYPRPDVATVFVERHTAGETTPIPEVRIHVRIDTNIAEASVICAWGKRYELSPIDVSEAGDIVEVALRIVKAAGKTGSAVDAT